jgi:hypothetical protein
MSIRTARLPLMCLLAVSVFALLAPGAYAQSRAGVRAGISIDPDQFYFGAHVDVKEVVERFWFRPNAEIGVGDHTTLVGLNGEFVYFPVVRSKEWTPYFGGGPALVFTSVKVNSNRDTDVGPGFNFVGGIQQRRGMLAEIKIGALDSPNFKLGIGWTW